MRAEYNQKPQAIVKGKNREIAVFGTDVNDKNLDEEVVKSFGEEWSKFHEFKKEEIDKIGDMYFDIVDEKIVNKGSYCIDIGCGTGRWSKYLAERAGFIECVDPSDAIFVADNLLSGLDNVRLSKASTDTIPFADQTFDFGMSIGVLHHIPDTQKALSDCVKKIKVGGHFYVYLYYALDNRGRLFRFVFGVSDLLRRFVSSLPAGIKRFFCDVLAIVAYMPFVLFGRFLRSIGLKGLAKKIPLSGYQDMSFFVIRNDALDRFGTKLEQRFTKEQVSAMMKNAGLEEVRVSPNFPYWHAIGKRKS
ncbi:MAG: class I SAM-dependent methyltransferase [Chitinophagaceae bacterium]|nr:class I SAM-dependent methyltransferase [Chitinophagaceae bacterium]